MTPSQVRYGTPDRLGHVGYGILDRHILIGEIRTMVAFGRHVLEIKTQSLEVGLEESE